MVSGVLTIDSAITGGGLAKLGTGILVLGGPLSYTGGTTVAGGTLEPLSPLPAAAVVTAGGVIGDGYALSDDQALQGLDPALVDLVATLFARDGCHRSGGHDPDPG